MFESIVGKLTYVSVLKFARGPELHFFLVLRVVWYKRGSDAVKAEDSVGSKNKAIIVAHFVIWLDLYLKR